MPQVPVLYALSGAESPRVSDYWLYSCLRRFSGFVAHVLALGVTIFLVILARPGTSLFSWHPVFMAAAEDFQHGLSSASSMESIAPARGKMGNTVARPKVYPNGEGGGLERDTKGETRYPLRSLLTPR
ncbi:uncharacterized protein LOC130356387 isoform X3 [Hyla sarda]|uniref:uncharacterized protein LOC130356387 isoform X3 n=1 Tax=Hyla sarda TaxID=327740 RepID=UPI0024C44E97|nr:uncharacterized protein LOC130356387 isoform X3 [Hyla sarda]